MLTCCFVQSGTTTIKASDLKSNMFNTTVVIKPELWSDCVDASGKLPLVNFKTTMSLNGTKSGKGTVGGEQKDRKKELVVHFNPAWKQC